MIEINWTDKANRQMIKLPAKISKQIAEKVLGLIDTWPNSTNVISLTNRPEYRLRVGSYRVIFTVSPNGEVVILNILEVRKRDDRTYKH